MKRDLCSSYVVCLRLVKSLYNRASPYRFVFLQPFRGDKASSVSAFREPIDSSRVVGHIGSCDVSAVAPATVLFTSAVTGYLLRELSCFSHESTHLCSLRLI